MATFQKIMYGVSFAVAIFLLGASFFMGNQRIAHADMTNPFDPNMAPEQICFIFSQFPSQASLFFPTFDVGQCGNGGGGEGGGEGGNFPQCMDGSDNDEDGLVDLADPGCENIGDNDETNVVVPPTDVCPNLEGDQAEVPEGYELSEGQCVPTTPTPPTDVCPNIEGDQETVPTGFHLDGENQCVADEVVDVCPNIEGDQAEIPAGKQVTDGECVDIPSSGGGENNGGGSGDTGTPPSGGGSNGPIVGSLGNGGGNGAPVGSLGNGGNGQVLGAATEVTSCDTYLTAFIKQNKENDGDQVKRLQSVLKNFENAQVEESGVYDDATLSAVKAFQTKYASDILSPWGVISPTGFVYLTTRKKVNEIYCHNIKTFPLTPVEEAIVNGAHVEADQVTAPVPALEKVEPAHTDSKTEGGASADDVSVENTEDTDKSPVGGTLRNFFKRLFGR